MVWHPMMLEAADKIIRLREELDATKRAADAFVENERLHEENARLHKQAEMNGRLLTENTELREENARLREALKFYADARNYEAVTNEYGDVYEGIGERDNWGDKARAALKGET